jgi:hypothetical protein
MRRSVACCVLAIVLVPFARSAALSAQEIPTTTAPLGLCRESACRIVYDWGGGQSTSSYPSDRRYGTPSDLETMLKSALTERGFRLRTDGDDAQRITIRVSMTSAICDEMPGTNTQRDCKTISDLFVQFAATATNPKPPNALMIRNRCGADRMMNIAQMARYTADFFAYELAPDKKGLSRAVGRC